ncbi:hypothetical protein QBC44DRAFT_263571 [Cladorrhinum sp. PSN332]|nr:hypothetical protein QBC44DRAFT_263571 [Cladorrhinum sp. PSN332]
MAVSKSTSWLGLLLSLLLLLYGPTTAHNPSLHSQQIILTKTGGFQIAGKTLPNPATNNLSETLSCDHAYVEYFLPHQPRKTSIVLWHSSSTQVWQNRWDGGPGFKDLLLRRRYPVYLWDGPRVGRANWGCEPHTYTPAFGLDQANFVNWNFGARFMEWFSGLQFPTGDKEAWKQATSARYLEFDTFENVKFHAEAMATAADSGKLGREIVYLTNSAGGFRAQLASTLSNSSNIKGIVAYESFGYVFPDIEGLNLTTDTVGGFGPAVVPLESFKRLARGLKFVQFIWGDHRAADHTMVAQSRKCAELINRFGGNAQVLMLNEDAGLKGNTHIPFADLNNEEVLRLVEDVLRKNRLDRFA